MGQLLVEKRWAIFVHLYKRQPMLVKVFAKGNNKTKNVAHKIAREKRRDTGVPHTVELIWYQVGPNEVKG